MRRSADAVGLTPMASPYRRAGQKDGMHVRTPRSVEHSETGSEAVTGETGHAARCSLRFWRIDRYQILPLARSSEASSARLEATIGSPKPALA
jgi:hypothetical protein